MIHQKVYDIPKELLEYSNYTGGKPENMFEMGINGERNTKINLAQFIVIFPLRRDSIFNAIIEELERTLTVVCLVGCNMNKWWPM